MMRDVRGRTALVTGASGGIGGATARALARAGMNVAVTGRRLSVLESLVAQLRAAGVRAESLSADLTDPAGAEAVIERAEQTMGAVDVLVNNAGVEYASAFDRAPREELLETVAVNLTAPLLMTRKVLPAMLSRGSGHVVFISSLAGKAGTPYEAAYSATKAALVGLTQSLRFEYRTAPVGFSVVCPGFAAGEGMYQRMVEQGIRSNRLLGETSTEKVGAAVLAAIERDLPEVLESGTPIRPLLAFAELAPGLADRVQALSGATELFRRAAAARGRA
jgi:short-subunit dehydrogenase